MKNIFDLEMTCDFHGTQITNQRLACDQNIWFLQLEYRSRSRYQFLRIWFQNCDVGWRQSERDGMIMQNLWFQWTHWERMLSDLRVYRNEIVTGANVSQNQKVKIEFLSLFHLRTFIDYDSLRTCDWIRFYWRFALGYDGLIRSESQGIGVALFHTVVRI